MAQFLRQTTSVIVHIGPFVAVGDGFTPQVGVTLTAADEAEVLKANTSATASISTLTWSAVTGADGWYALSLTTAETNTVGTLTVVVNDDSVCLPVFARFQVLEEAIFDSLFAASAAGFDANQDVTVGSFAAASLTSAAIATSAIIAAHFNTDAIASAAVGSTAVAKITAAVATSASIAALATSVAVGALPTSAAIADAVWDELVSQHVGAGSTGERLERLDLLATGGGGELTSARAVLLDNLDAAITTRATSAQIAAVATSASIATLATSAAVAALPASTADAVWDELQSQHVGAASFGEIATEIASILDDTGTAGVIVGAVNAAGLADFFDTDSGTTYSAAVAGSVVKQIADNAGGSALTEAGIADAVWDELISQHVGAGTAGERVERLDIIAAGGAGGLTDTRATNLDNLDAAITTRATSAQITGVATSAAVAALPTSASIADAVWDELQSQHVGAASFGEMATEIASILDDTGTAGVIVASIASDAVTSAAVAAAAVSKIQAGLATSAAVDTVDGVVDAIKAKTDSLTFTVAGQVDANIESVNGTGITGSGTSADPWGP